MSEISEIRRLAIDIEKEKEYNSCMNLKKLEMILADQQESLNVLLAEPTCRRAEEAQINLDSKLAQVVTGVRRSGKSTLCLNVLKQSDKPFGYVNFDDERLASLTGADLDEVLAAAYKVYGQFTHLFLDEPQNIPEWSLFVNRLLRSGMHVLITGSNSNLLAGELVTHMTGRYKEIKLLPFSFKEYCEFKKVDLESMTLKARALRSSAFDEYLKKGAFPEIASGEDPRSYIRTLIENIRTKDIERRYKIRYRLALKKLMDYVLNTVPATPDYDELAKLCGFSSRHTSENYVEYMERSFLVNRISKYSSKPRVRLVGEKLYAVDVAFMSERDNSMQGENLGWRMETIVALELLRRSRREFKDVYYYLEAGHECDFVVCDQRKVEALYQVTYDMSSNPKTRKREINGAVSAAKATGLREATIITYSELDEIEDSSGIRIHIVPISEWLPI